jgi:hypothetical protein
MPYFMLVTVIEDNASALLPAARVVLDADRQAGRDIDAQVTGQSVVGRAAVCAYVCAGLHHTDQHLTALYLEQ